MLKYLPKETEDYNVNIVSTTPTGIYEIGKSNTGFFYPNPANGIIYIDPSLKSSEMAIYNIEGKLMKRDLINNTKIDVSTLTPGQYIIKWMDRNNVYTQRLTITQQ